MERNSVISFGSDKDHVLNYFLQMLEDDEALKSRFTVEKTADKVKLTLLKSSALKVIKANSALEDLYNHSRVNKLETREENEKLVTISIPKDLAFLELVFALNPVAKKVDMQAGGISISGSSEDFRLLLLKDEYQTKQFKKLLVNAEAKATEIVTSFTLLLGNRLSAREYPNVSAFIPYLESGQFEVPPLSTDEVLKLSHRIKIVGCSLGAAGVLGGLAYFGGSLVKYGKELFDSEKRFGEMLRNHEESADPSLFRERLLREDAERAASQPKQSTR